ncbi:MAG: ROK family protein [Spirochaetota bacterium]
MQLNKVNEVNTTRVLQQIWLSGGTTRVAIARDLGLVKSTVSRIVTMLLERGLIRETSWEQKTGVGRTPVRLEVNEKYGIVVGLELQTDFFNAVATDLNGEELRTWSGSISMSGKDTVTGFFEIMERLEPWIVSCGAPLIGVGVAFAGQVDQSRGVILQSNPLNIFEPVPFAREVKDRITVPVIIENDANCGCWGELVSRKTLRHTNFVFVLGEFRTGETEQDLYWGIAIGLGLVLNGEVYHGASHSAGEFQSILWRPGNEGQLSISNDEARRIKEDMAIMTAALHELCAHVAFLVNTLNLTNVVFGGEIADFREMLVPILDAEIQKNWSYANRVEYTVEFSEKNTYAVAYGAAGMFLESIYTIPDMFAGAGSATQHEISVLGER